MELVIVAIVGGLLNLLTAVVVILLGKKVGETHRQVTVNHHSSEKPTILDELSNIKSLLLEHLAWHDKKDK
jgi:hypothetical protein